MEKFKNDYVAGTSLSAPITAEVLALMRSYAPPPENLTQRPGEYVRYPHEGHDLSRTNNPKQRMDRLNRIIEFFFRFI